MASTLLQLRKRTLIYLNDLQKIATGNGVRYNDVALNQIINDVTVNYVKIINRFYQGYLSIPLSINLLANTNKYALGSTFRSPIYEARRTINGMDYPLAPKTPYLYTLDTTPIPNTSFLPDFWLEGNSIVFSQFPAANEANGVTIKFPMKSVSLVNDGDALDDQLYEVEDCVVIRTAQRALRAKDVSGALKNVSGWDKELQDAELTLYGQIGNRYLISDKPKPIPIYDDY